MDRFDQTLWWQVYPLGFVGAPIRTPDDGSDRHRLRRLLPWLDHVVELGANGLLLGPVFAAASHGYDTLDHFRIDPRLGDRDDFDALVSAAHERGIRIGLDGVFNHVADTHPFVLDALAHGPDGRYAGWFAIDRDAPGGPRPAVFEGHGSLVELDHGNPDVQRYIADVLAHWSAAGVDAWRLDAAYAVPAARWRPILADARAGGADGWYLAEVLHGDYAEFVAESTVDTTTQYELWKAIWSSLKDGNFFELDWALTRHTEMVASFAPATFVGNHDVTRIATRVGHERAVLALVVLMTVGGVPTIYAGDELGYEGLKEERVGGDDAIRPEFPAAPGLGAGEAVFRLHQAMIGLRRRHPWLVGATTEKTELTNTRYVYTSAAGSASLTVELDLTTSPTAVVRDAAGTELFAYRA